MNIDRRLGVRLQAIIIGIFLVTMVFIIQTQSLVLYRVGLVVLMVTTFFQIAIGNAPLSAGWLRIGKTFGITIGVTVILVGIAILLAPMLVKLGGA